MRAAGERLKMMAEAMWTAARERLEMMVYATKAEGERLKMRGKTMRAAGERQ